MDTHHLNAKGAEAFSTLFSKFYTGEIGEKELFYNSYDEKISNHKERIYGLITNVSETEDGTEKMLSISPVDNTEKAIYYRITKTAENSTEEIRLQDFDVNSVLYLPKEENGTVNIEATFDHKKYNCVTIKY